MGFGESGCYVFCVHGSGGARGGVGDGEEEGMFDVAEEITESEW